MKPWYLLAHQLADDGYGYMSIKAAEALLAAGARVEPVDMRTEEKEFTPAGARRWVVDGDALTMMVPDWLPDVTATRIVISTMFEATLPPADWIERINRYTDALVVPCEWNRAIFRARGVTVPVHVAPLGVDGGDWWLMDRPRDGAEPYRFLWNGNPDKRKGWDVAYRAFRMAFGDDAGAELVLHWRSEPDYKGVMLEITDQNVRTVAGKLPRAEFRALYQAADCFVYPSRGEGWGLPPREAAATGLPAIATDATGLAVDIERWGIPLRVKRWVPAWHGFWERGTVGEWAEPDVDHLAELMRWCYEHREAAAALGQRAADWIAAHNGWDVTARALRGVME